MNRRSFLEKSSLGAVTLATASYVPSFSQNRKLNIGLIGAGWYGMVITRAALSLGDVKVLGVCDVDTAHLKESADELEKLQGSRPKTFASYQDLLDMKGLDAVFIGTPPHWHALQFIAACEKGLDIYCEKPLAYDIKEGIAMIRAAKKAGNIAQIGFQRRQSKAFQKAKEYIDAGKIGEVRQIGAQIHYNPGIGDTAIQDPPVTLDWDTWCGPAPKLDYRPSIGHKAWRLEKEYGNGHLVDWGIHHIDIIRKTMNLGMPVSFSTTGDLSVLAGSITTPDTLNARMNFEECPVMWQHRLWGSGDLNPEFNNGVFFYGEKGTLFAADRKVVIMPAGRDQQQITEEVNTPTMQENHVGDFLKAVRAKDRSLVSCTVEDAFQSTATVQLAMISYYTNSAVRWDAKSNAVLDNAEAAKLLARIYRSGYDRPAIN